MNNKKYETSAKLAFVSLVGLLITFIIIMIDTHCV
jgi:hypothetical protein